MSIRGIRAAEFFIYTFNTLLYLAYCYFRPVYLKREIKYSMYIFDRKQLYSLTPKRVWNIIKIVSSYYLSRVTKRPWVSGYPPVLSIEPTSLCNLKCPQCPTGMGTLNRPGGYLDFDLYRSIIDELGEYATTVQLFFQGEPFMHKQLPDMIGYAKKKNIYTVTSTNGHFLNEKIVKSVLQSELDTIVVGLDGVSPEVYRSYRRGGNLETAVKGMENLISERNRTGGENPKVCLQFIVFRSNEDQIEAVKEFGKKLGVDKVLIKSGQIYPETDFNEYLPDNPRYSRYIRDKETIRLKTSVPNHCKRIWTNAVFTWDGTMASCCFDKDTEHAFGKWNGNSFKELWRSEKGMQFRKQVLADRTAIPMCSNCTEGTKEWL